MTQVLACLPGRNAWRHTNKIDLSTSNCATRNDVRKYNKHDPVHHLDLDISDWTTHLESHAIYQHADRNCASGVWYSEDSLRRCLLHLRVSSTSTVGKLRIAKWASPSRDSGYTEVSGLRTHKVGIDRQDTCMVSVSAASEWCRTRSTAESHIPCNAVFEKLSLFVC